LTSFKFNNVLYSTSFNYKLNQVAIAKYNLD
jgi:hypothetical protein